MMEPDSESSDVPRERPGQQAFSVSGKSFSRYSPYLIAEIGANHEGDLGEAKKMIASAARAGANAVKFQTYTADRLASRTHSPAYWDTTQETRSSQFELFSHYDKFSPSDYMKLADFAASCNVDFLSTPFDSEAVEFLAPLVPAFKIASADLTNTPLIEQVASHQKPMIISTGASSIAEIDLVQSSLSGHPADISLLHCVLNYPTPPERANLEGIRRLELTVNPRFSIGYSDHVPPDSYGGMESLKAAFLLGAVVIEKHYTHNRLAKGNDHYHAMDEAALETFVSWTHEAREMMGGWLPDLSIQAAARSNARRRIFLNETIPQGTRLQEAHLIPLRSNKGVPVSDWKSILGKVSLRDLKSGDPLLPGDF